MSEKVNVASKDEHPHLTEARKHFAASRESMHQSMAELVPKGYLEHRGQPARKCSWHSAVCWMPRSNGWTCRRSNHVVCTHYDRGTNLVPLPV